MIGASVLSLQRDLSCKRKREVSDSSNAGGQQDSMHR